MMVDTGGRKEPTPPPEKPKGLPDGTPPPEELDMIPLGSIVKDRHTGFAGRATAYTMWVNGCNRYEITPTDLDKDGKPKEAAWFDEQEVELVEDRPFKPRVSGGPPIHGDPRR